MYSILIIDDEPIVKIALRSILPWEEHGFSICGTASNGLEALPLIEQHHPDVIITDLKMPKMDGLEMVSRLREAGNSVFVIILTAYDSFAYAQSALRLGAVDFLLKPFHDGDLEKAVLTLQGRLKAQSERTNTASGVPGVKKGGKSRYVLEAMDYIGQNYADSNLSVGQIAAQLDLSEGHLSHLFKKETDYTIGNYLTRYRIHKAMELLRQGRLKVYEVAEAVGYRDIAYFSATFQKVAGMSPSEYQDSQA